MTLQFVQFPWGPPRSRGKLSATRADAQQMHAGACLAVPPGGRR
jgi:hypothetical protein